MMMVMITLHVLMTSLMMVPVRLVAQRIPVTEGRPLGKPVPGDARRDAKTVTNPGRKQTAIAKQARHEQSDLAQYQSFLAQQYEPAEDQREQRCQVELEPEQKRDDEVAREHASCEAEER